jgi:hypothetical protein
MPPAQIREPRLKTLRSFIGNQELKHLLVHAAIMPTAERSIRFVVERQIATRIVRCDPSHESLMINSQAAARPQEAA